MALLINSSGAGGFELLGQRDDFRSVEFARQAQSGRGVGGVVDQAQPPIDDVAVNDGETDTKDVAGFRREDEVRGFHGGYKGLVSDVAAVESANGLAAFD